MLDVATLQKLMADDHARQEAALKVQQTYDIKLPELSTWNYQPCRQHRVWVDDDGKRYENTPKPLCQKCGIILRRHQRVGVPWLYLAKQALLADFVGSGKTIHAGGLLALMQEAGDLDGRRAVIIVGRPSAILQWESELNRMLPKLKIVPATGNPKQRLEKYLEPWDVMLIGPQMLIKDVDKLLHFSIAALIIDDCDLLRHRENKTAYTIRRFRNVERKIIMSATPLQKKLLELYNILELLGADAVLGTVTAFDHRYVRRERITNYNKETGTTTTQEHMVGYKRLPEFKRLIAPYALRRTPDDIEDVTIPKINPVDHWLDLYDEQRRQYNELKRGVVQIMRSDEFGNMSMVKKQATAMAKLVYASKICDGLVALGDTDGPETSVKLDWLSDKVSGDLGEEKIVVFVLYKPTIRAVQARLEAVDVGYETIWGEERSPYKRKASQERFWDDPKCRVLIGTTAIEQSLNLQCARHLVNVGQIMNPARMLQLAGRIARAGSRFNHVWVHNLRCVGTHEESYLRKLEREQALANFIWEEESELFKQISPMEMLQLIGRS